MSYKVLLLKNGRTFGYAIKEDTNPDTLLEDFLGGDPFLAHNNKSSDSVGEYDLWLYLNSFDEEGIKRDCLSIQKELAEKGWSVSWTLEPEEMLAKPYKESLEQSVENYGTVKGWYLYAFHWSGMLKSVAAVGYVMLFFVAYVVKNWGNDQISYAIAAGISIAMTAAFLWSADYLADRSTQ